MGLSSPTEGRYASTSVAGGELPRQVTGVLGRRMTDTGVLRAFGTCFGCMGLSWPM